MNQRYLTIAVLIALASATELQTPVALATVDIEDYQKASCFVVDDLTFYDFLPLWRKEGYTNAGYKVNFCKPFEVADPLDKTKTVHTFVYKQSSGDVFTDGDLIIKDKETLEDEDGVRHLVYYMDTNKTCATNSSRIVETIFDIDCNEDGNRGDEMTDLKVNDTDPCALVVTGSHKAACPVFQATSIVEFLTNHPWIMGVALIVFGVVATFFGGKFFPYVLATVGGGMTFLVVLVLCSAFGGLKALETKSHAKDSVALAVFCFILAFVLAVLVGWFVKKIRRVGAAVLGAVVGFFLGFTLYNFVFALWFEHVAALVLIAFGCSIAGAYLAWVKDKLIVVYLTALLGAYCLVRGISVFAGGYPNEISMFTQLVQGVFELPPAYFGYLCGFVVTALVGVVVQHKLGYHEHHHENDEYHKV